MALNDDGDIIRGLGYVCLYSAYLEEAIDEVFELVLSADLVITDKEKAFRWQISRKIDYIESFMSTQVQLPQELAGFVEALSPTKVLLDKRNLVVHGRIYNQPGSGDVLKPARRGLQEIKAKSAELYDLANELFAARAPYMYASMFAIPRLLSPLSEPKA